MNKFIKVLLSVLGFLLCIGGGAIGALVYIHSIEEGLSKINKISNGDIIGLSNTYIVYTTYIFVVMSVILVLLSIYVSIRTGKKHEEFLKENLKDFIDIIQKDNNIQENFIKSLAKNDNFIEKIIITIAEKEDLKIDIIKEKANIQLKKE